MKIWAIADLHLCFGVPSKSMELFGPTWKDYTRQIEKHWRAQISDEDLVLIAGDISWAMKPEDAVKDLEWIDQLPGTKVMIRGNHDYWWSSLSKVQKILPASIHAIHLNTYSFDGVSIGGARLWDTEEYNFNQYIEFRENPAEKKEKEPFDNQKIFERELQRLEMSLKQLDQKAKCRMVMTHYPPIGADLRPSRTSCLLKQYNVDVCIFGHLHQVRAGSLPFGTVEGTAYHLTSCDYLGFDPQRIEYANLH